MAEINKLFSLRPSRGTRDIRPSKKRLAGM